MDEPKNSSLKVGLALGSGASRALAHLGVIQAIEEAGITIDCIAGSSMGALIGASYASGEIEKLRNHALEMDWRQLTSYLDFNFPQQGLLEGEKLIQLIEFLLPHSRFKDLDIPLAVTATNLSTGDAIDFQEGNLIHAIRASISLPGIFNPFKIDGSFLVDGGLVNPVPVDVVQNMGADLVIAVDLNNDLITRNGREKRFRMISRNKKHKQKISDDHISNVKNNKNWVPPKLEEKYRSFEQSLRNSMNNLFDQEHKKEEEKEEDWEPNIFDVIANSINIMEYHITQGKLVEDQPDILIQPQLGHLNLLEFDEAEPTIQEGYEVTREQLKKMDRIFSSASQSGSDIQ